MKTYRISDESVNETYLQVLLEKPDSYEVLITRIYADYKLEKTEIQSRPFFENCIRTQYLTEVTEKTDKLTA